MLFPWLSWISKLRWKIWLCCWHQKYNNFTLIGAQMAMQVVKLSHIMDAEASGQNTVTLASKLLQLALLMERSFLLQAVLAFHNQWLVIAFHKQISVLFVPLQNFRKHFKNWTRLEIKDFHICLQEVSKVCFEFFLENS